MDNITAYDDMWKELEAYRKLGKPEELCKRQDNLNNKDKINHDIEMYKGCALETIAMVISRNFNTTTILDAFVSLNNMRHKIADEMEETIAQP